MNPEPRPPRIAEWILRRVVPPGVVGESILGDQRESFSEAIQSRGPLRARADYWTDVLRIAIHRPRRTRGVHLIRESGHNGRWLEALAPDAKLALRMLVKSPLLTVVGGLGLAVGIAVSIGFFTFMTFYYADPPVEDGHRVVSVGDISDGDSSLFDYQVWKAELQSIEDLAAYRTVERDLRSPMTVSGPAVVAEITASAFRVARVPPLLGRPLLDSDEVQGVPRVVVIGYREWRQRFGADPAVVGRQIRLDGTPHTVVGVMPEDFRLPVDHGFWTPLVTGTAVAGTPGGPQIYVFGRLAPGVEAGTAQAEVAVIGARMMAEHPKIYEGLRPVVRPYIRQALDMQDVPAWQIWLAQIFGGLILIAVSVNVAVLFYARTARRRVEIIVRTALGASRSRIVTQLFLEALALSAVAAALGLLIAWLGFRQLTLLADFQGLPYWLLGGLPSGTVLYAAALATLTALVVGALPALQATGRHLQSTLREMGGGTGLRIGTTWTFLICVQVAIAVGVLPAVVGIAWSSTPPPTPTFPASQILQFKLPPSSPLPGAAEPGQSTADAGYGSRQAELIRLVEAIPEVAGVTFTSTTSSVRIEVEDPTIATESTTSGSVRVDIDYFGVFGVPMLAGRSFAQDDAVEESTAAIVNRAFVDQYFAGERAVGRQFREVTVEASEGYVPSARRFIVVGVVENMVQPSDPYAYHPMDLGTEPLGLAARTRGIDAASISPRVREIAAQIAPGSALSASPMDSSYDGNSTGLRLILSMVSLATLSVLLLSAAGISAMMSFAVTQRRREIGIRTALGATRGQVLASLFWRSTRQLGIGLVVGAAGSALLDRLTGGEMLGGEVVPLLAIVAATMLLSGLIATIGPARRALRIQPTEALREE